MTDFTVRPSLSLWPISKPQSPHMQGKGTWAVFGLNTAGVCFSRSHPTVPRPRTLPGPRAERTIYTLSSLPGCFAEPGRHYRHCWTATSCQGCSLSRAPQSGKLSSLPAPPCSQTLSSSELTVIDICIAGENEDRHQKLLDIRSWRP